MTCPLPKLIQRLIRTLICAARSLQRRLRWSEIKKIIVFLHRMAKAGSDECPISRGFPSKSAVDDFDICKLNPLPEIKKSPHQNTCAASISEPLVLQPATNKGFETAAILALTDCITDSNLKELIKDRLSEIDDETGNIEKQALCAVNLYDEINTFIRSYKGKNNEQLEKILSRILSELRHHHCELIDEDTWNPEHQRAVAIAYTLPENSTPIISEKKSTGLIVNNRLIRKQEVTLLKSKI